MAHIPESGRLGRALGIVAAEHGEMEKIRDVVAELDERETRCLLVALLSAAAGWLDTHDGCAAAAEAIEQATARRVGLCR